MYGLPVLEVKIQVIFLSDYNHATSLPVIPCPSFAVLQVTVHVIFSSQSLLPFSDGKQNKWYDGQIYCSQCATHILVSLLHGLTRLVFLPSHPSLFTLAEGKARAGGRYIHRVHNFSTSRSCCTNSDSRKHAELFQTLLASCSQGP